MTTIALRKQIHRYIDSSDVKILRAVHTILENHLKLKTQSSVELSDKDMEELDKGWDNYKKGKTKNYTLDQVNKTVSRKLKSIKQ